MAALMRSRSTPHSSCLAQELGDDDAMWQAAAATPPRYHPNQFQTPVPPRVGHKTLAR